MAVYVIAVFLCGMNDGSGHDCASDNEYLSLSSPLYFQCNFGALDHLHPNAGQWRRLRYEKELH